MGDSEFGGAAVSGDVGENVTLGCVGSLLVGAELVGVGFCVIGTVGASILKVVGVVGKIGIVGVGPEISVGLSIGELDGAVVGTRVRSQSDCGAPIILKGPIWSPCTNGSEQEVRGEGVVGEQPILNPGEKFEYTSGTPLSTPSGFMGGYYEMETTKGKKFEAIIPQFSLDSPFIKNNLN